MTEALRELEELVVDAWPARDADELDGWLLRASGGPSRRGNSVSTLGVRATRELDERISAVEAWYAQRGASAIFQVGPCAQPKELDAVLEVRGYRAEGETAFAVADVESLCALPVGAPYRIDVTTKATPAWLDVTTEASRYREHLDGLRDYFKRLGSRCRFATAFADDGSAHACCVGITSEDRLGVYNMLSVPGARRRGAARALLRGLAESAQRERMRELYLLVELANEPARALYAQVGFTDVYTYRYRVAPS